MSSPNLDKSHATEKFSAPSKSCSNKFAPDGSVLPFPGLTVLHHLTNSNLRIALRDDDFRNYMDTLSHRYIRLPDESYHSTLLDVKVYHESRDQAFRNVTFAEEKRAADLKTFLERFTAMQSDLSSYLPIRMKIDLNEARLPREGRALSVPLVLYEPEDRIKIDSLRKRLSSAFDMDADPGYKFHITLYYPYTPISDDEFAPLLKHWPELLKRISDAVPVFEVNTVELCSFDDMWKYSVVKAVHEVSHSIKGPGDMMASLVGSEAGYVYPLVVLAVFIFVVRRILK